MIGLFGIVITGNVCNNINACNLFERLKASAEIENIKCYINKKVSDKLCIGSEFAFGESSQISAAIPNDNEVSNIAISEGIIKISNKKNYVELPDTAFSEVYYNQSENILEITADKAASYPIFYIIRKGWIAFAPRVKFLLQFSEDNSEIDLSSVAQLLVNGHLIGDQTLHPEIRRLRGGQQLKIENDVAILRWWNQFVPGSKQSFRNNDEADAILGEAVDGAVNYCLPEGTGKAAVFLSGGVDSRVILGAAERVAIASKSELRTVTWATKSGAKSESDVAIAGLLSKIVRSKHLVLERNIHDYLAYLDKTVWEIDALSEMGAFHPHEYKLMKHLADLGFLRALRGDEAFGWRAKVDSYHSAFTVVRIGLFLNSPLAQLIVRKSIRDKLIFSSNNSFKEMVDEVHGISFSQMKDYLYFNHRLQCYLLSSSYFKQRVFIHNNPLLHGAVLSVIERLTDEQRDQKSYFESFARRYFPYLWSVPLATSSNLENWPQIIRTNFTFQQFIQRHIDDKDSMVWNFIEQSEIFLLFQNYLVNENLDASGAVQHYTGKRLHKSIISPITNLFKGRRNKQKIFHIEIHRLLMRFITLKIWIDKINSI
jgi:hypothetical protein